MFFVYQFFQIFSFDTNEFLFFRNTYKNQCKEGERTSFKNVKKLRRSQQNLVKRAISFRWDFDVVEKSDLEVIPSSPSPLLKKSNHVRVYQELSTRTGPGTIVLRGPLLFAQFQRQIRNSKFV